MMLRTYFLKLRSTFVPSETIFPLTIRTFESLIRLVQARAKLACRNQVEPEDVEEIKDLFNQLLTQSLFDAEDTAQKKKNEIDRTDVSNLSIPKQTKIFLEVLAEEANMKKEKTFTLNQLRDIARAMKMRVGEFYSFIEKLNFEGHLLKKANEMYVLLSDSVNI
jgi:DNA helicase MCM8